MSQSTGEDPTVAEIFPREDGRAQHLDHQHALLDADERTDLAAVPPVDAVGRTNDSLVVHGRQRARQELFREDHHRSDPVEHRRSHEITTNVLTAGLAIERDE